MTARAIGAIIAIPILVAIGWILGYQVVLVIAVGAALLVILAALLVSRPPTSRLERTVTPDRVTRGESAKVTLSRRNRSPSPAAPLEAVDTIGALTVAITIPLARPASSSQASYRFVTTRRGHLTIGPAELSRRDPWGLFRRTRVVGEPGELLVYPRVLSIAPPELLVHLTRDAGAVDVTAGSDRFHTLREYVVGDELRKVHWPSTAKTGTMVVKQLVDAPQPRMMVFLDCDVHAYPTPDTFEQAVDTVASLAHAIAAAGLPFTLAAGTSHPTVDVTRPADLNKLMDQLALVIAESSPASVGDIRALVLRTRATALVGVSGPGNRFLGSITGVRSSISESALYRLGSSSRPITVRRRGLVINDAPNADEMVKLLPPTTAPKRARQ